MARICPAPATIRRPPRRAATQLCVILLPAARRRLIDNEPGVASGVAWV